MKTMISFQCDTLEEARAVIDAVAAIGKQPHACSKQYVEPEELIRNENAEFAKSRGFPHSPAEPRKNVSPGEPSITKIGSSTLEVVLGMLKDGHQPPEKYSEHMKLLWKRDKVKFDGSNFYL